MQCCQQKKRSRSLTLEHVFVLEDPLHDGRWRVSKGGVCGSEHGEEASTPTAATAEQGAEPRHDQRRHQLPEAVVPQQQLHQGSARRDRGQHL